jgi:hypothetical protein
MVSKSSPYALESKLLTQNKMNEPRQGSNPAGLLLTSDEVYQPPHGTNLRSIDGFVCWKLVFEQNLGLAAP